ncbi:MAG TPA: hypothetical protein VKA21_14725, partial [Candidatus Binatia bacterium]|nr:hypothetical protein [Candidatus Binatia bacterium]
MPRIALAFVSLLVLVVPPPARAAFHLANIDEVASGHSSDASAQYVEIRMLGVGQQFVQHTRLTAFSCDGSVVTVLINDLPADVCNQGVGVRWSMGTASWASTTGVTPDFTFTAGIPTPCGQICWGAPGSILPPTDPNTWAASNPDNYVDCVAYGGYTGPRQTFDAAASALAPGDGNTMSLQRTGDTSNDATDFALAVATPANNGTCPTTTTTAPATTTTTTLAPPVQSKCAAKKMQLAGKKAFAFAKCHAKSVGKAITLEHGCFVSAAAKFDAGFKKADLRADCLTSDDAAAIEAKVDAFDGEAGSDLVAELQTGPGPSKCTAKKLTLAGKKVLARLKCVAKAVGKGTAISPECLGKANDKYAAGWAKAELGSDCQTN